MSSKSPISWNPFESPGIPSKEIVVWANRKRVKDAITRYIESRSAGVEVLTIIGRYGSGKTHTLYYIKNELQNRGAFTIFIPNPGQSFMDLYREALVQIDTLNLALYARNLIERNRKKILSELQKNSEILVKFPTEELTGHSRLLRYLFPELDADLAQALDSILQRKFTQTAINWIEGAQLNRSELAKIGVSSAISVDRAPKILADIFRIIIAHGNKAALILDEFEDITLQSSQKALSYLKALRRLIDENVKGLKIVVGIAEEAWADLESRTGIFRARAYDAIVQRLQTNYITLSSLDLREIVEFITDLVNASLEKGFEISSVIEERALVTLAEILEENLRETTPRQIILTCKGLFEKALSEGRWPIDEEFVQRYMESFFGK